MDLSPIAGTVLIVLVLRFLLKADPVPINGVYVQPGKWYWLKRFVFRLLLWLRKRQSEKELLDVNDQNAGYGRKSRNSPEDMDKIQTLPPKEAKAVDAVYFTGSNEEGQFMVTATARRQNNLVQTILLLRLPGVGLLELPSIPDTNLEGTLPDEYAAGGLHIQALEPMKRWKIKFNGKLRLQKTQEELDVNFDLDWVARSACFDFDTDLHPDAMIDAIARETWSRKYFETLKRFHQTHYEQFGDTTGTVHISGRDDVQINIRGVRDHSYGNIRDWSLIHRYCLQYVSLADGSMLCIGTVSMPVTTCRLTVGYLFHPDGRMDSISSSEFEFYKFGDNGKPMEDFKFKFTAGGKIYTLEVDVIQTVVFYMGENRDATVHERFANFKLNGVKGWGLSEWEYSNRPVQREQM